MSTDDYSKELFEQEIKNIPQSLCKDDKNCVELHHDLKVEVTKWFNSPTSVMIPHDQEGKPAIVVEMPPSIRAKDFANMMVV